MKPLGRGGSTATRSRRLATLGGWRFGKLDGRQLKTAAAMAGPRLAVMARRRGDDSMRRVDARPTLIDRDLLRVVLGLNPRPGRGDWITHAWVTWYFLFFFFKPDKNQT